MCFHDMVRRKMFKNFFNFSLSFFSISDFACHFYYLQSNPRGDQCKMRAIRCLGTCSFCFAAYTVAAAHVSSFGCVPLKDFSEMRF